MRGGRAVLTIFPLLILSFWFMSSNSLSMIKFRKLIKGILCEKIWFFVKIGSAFPEKVSQYPLPGIQAVHHPSLGDYEDWKNR